ncbi:hypothetical protein [Spiroplasma endosymbiont of Labia minor]|uniref:hypothetical protein n=1 Tax=Spiroplasma endosymbiont of Labia minor TaxID=3066305 RepID=UPI0030CC3B00
MENFVTIDQSNYFEILLKQFDGEKIKKYTQKTKFNLPSAKQFKELNRKQAASVIGNMSSFLKIRKNIVINQDKEHKTLSNIIIKNEWIISKKFGQNSIKVRIPDYENNRFLIVHFPKGGFEDPDKKLVYSLKDFKYEGKTMDRLDFTVCGIKSTWKCWLQIESNNEKDIVHRKKHVNYLDLFDTLKVTNELLLNEQLIAEAKFVSTMDSVKRRLKELEQNKAMKQKIAEAKERIKITEEAKALANLELINIEQIVTDPKQYNNAPESPPPKKIDKKNKSENNNTVISDFDYDDFI